MPRFPFQVHRLIIYNAFIMCPLAKSVYRVYNEKKH